MALDGREGARRVIQAHPGETAGVPFPEGAFDIDTAKDYARLTAMSGSALVLLRDQVPEEFGPELLLFPITSDLVPVQPRARQLGDRDILLPPLPILRKGG